MILTNRVQFLTEALVEQLNIDKNTGECYKPASYKAPAKGVRYLITQLADNPHICDAYGSFLYL